MMRRAARKLCDYPVSSWRLGRLARTTFQASDGTYLLARGLLTEHRSDHVQTFGCNTHHNRNHMQMSWTTFCLSLGSALAIGSGLSETAMNEAGPKVNESNSGVDSGSVSNESIDPDKVMEQVETGIQNRLKTLNLSSSILPTYTITAKGQQTSVKFPISPLCDLWGLIVDVISQMGRLNSGLADGKLKVSASESPVAQMLTLEELHENFRTDMNKHAETNLDSSSGPLRIWVFEPLIGEKFPEIEFSKKGFYSEEELDLVVSILHLAVTEKTRGGTPRDRYKRAHERKKNGGDDKAVSALEAIGVKVYGKDSLTGTIDREAISWDNIAGYHEQKREIEDSVLLALRCPEVYDNIARGTRQKFESNRPRAILFEGPPGTGKTSSARVIANQAGVPMLYVPLEAVVSKYYGESERILGKVFDNANKFPNGSIIFLDEIDALAMTRDSEMHEATRRMLSVLLRQIDGFEQDSRVVVIAATNRKEDLDPALISRFNSSITFGLPDRKTREEITAQYARHLTSSELAAIAEASEGMSGRDLQNICQQAERHWASKLIRNKAESSMIYTLPTVEEYLECAVKKRISNHILSQKNGIGGRSGHHPRTHPNWPPSVVV